MAVPELVPIMSVTKIMPVVALIATQRLEMLLRLEVVLPDGRVDDILAAADEEIDRRDDLLAPGTRPVGTQSISRRART